ncbi:MAG: glycosyl transferase family 2 [Hyphomicrobiales bacterium]|nr:glycosyl transferase family 2 [Hyphomicrobiales bacterium]
MTTRELHIVVAALTYRRPEGIAKLLDVLRRQIHMPERPFRVTVMVVDNDASGSARGAVEAFSNTGSYELIYVVEQQQGIPLARNRAIDTAPPDTDLFCFLDDDEWPVDNWLDAMLAVRERTGADCVYGPVEPVYPAQPPEFFLKSRVFERRRNADGARINYAASNNVMIDYHYMRQHNMRFEEKMRFTGGSDYLFFNQAVRGGMKIFWADDALVYDIIPASRMTWNWLLQRQYRLGNTFAVRDSLYGTGREKLRRFAYGCARVGLGVVMLPALAVSPRWGMRSVSHILRGAGMVSGILGHAYQEYAPTKLETQGK